MTPIDPPAHRPASQLGECLRWPRLYGTRPIFVRNFSGAGVPRSTCQHRRCKSPTSGQALYEASGERPEHLPMLRPRTPTQWSSPASPSRPLPRRTCPSPGLRRRLCGSPHCAHARHNHLSAHSIMYMANFHTSRQVARPCTTEELNGTLTAAWRPVAVPIDSASPGRLPTPPCTACQN